MDNKKFKEEIYIPYQEAWVLIKDLQNLKSSGDDEAWKVWNEKTLKFRERHDDDFGHVIFRMLTDAGDVIGKMNG